MYDNRKLTRWVHDVPSPPPLPSHSHQPPRPYQAAQSTETKTTIRSIGRCGIKVNKLRVVR